MLYFRVYLDYLDIFKLLCMLVHSPSFVRSFTIFLFSY